MRCRIAEFAGQKFPEYLKAMANTSVDLVEGLRADECGSAEALFARYVERLNDMVRWQLSPGMRKRFDPEDVVCSAYRTFFLHARKGDFTLKNSGDLWKLLVTITLNKLRRQIAHHRALKRTASRERPLNLATLQIGDGPTPLEALAFADQLATFMQKLTPLQQQVLEMRLSDHDWNEIAESAGLSPRTARRVLEEIRSTWQRLIADEDGAVFQQTPHIGRVESVSPVPSPSNLLDYRDFSLLEMVGSGGMGKVYRSWQRSASRQIAVKMLRKARWSFPGAVQRFLEEARMVMDMCHPGIVQVYGVGQTPGGGLFFAMEFIDGEDLEKATRGHAASAAQACAWVAQAARALDYAHQQGIVHCDLKPSNLLLSHSGRIVVSDFGLATSPTSPAAAARQWAGTPGYMAPEQLDPAFGIITSATDIFSLGLILHRLLTRQTIFEGDCVLQVLAHHASLPALVNNSLKHVDVPAALRALLTKCLAIEPAERLQSATDLATQLEQIAAKS